MALESIDMQSVIDTAFVLLVALVCGRSLFTASSGSGEGRRSRWKDELEALQHGLKDLIAEAGAASSRLDRSLQKRRTELETLLTKLEAAESRVTQNAGLSAQEGSGADDDFPNETWCTATDRETSSYQSAPAPSLNKEPGTGAGEGPSLQGYTRSKVPPAAFSESAFADAQSAGSQANGSQFNGAQFTGKEMNSLVEAAQQSMASAQNLASASMPTTFSREAIELEKSEEELEEDERLSQQTFEQTSIMDVVTYRIARRLLTAGKELHIVARKVDLPVSEIRLLDQLMREEAKIKARRENPVVDSEGETSLDDTLPLSRPAPKNKPQIIAPQQAAREFTPGKFGRILHEEREEERRAAIELQQEIEEDLPSRNLDEDIERELALL